MAPVNLPSDYADGLSVTSLVAEDGDTVVKRTSTGYLELQAVTVTERRRSG